MLMRRAGGVSARLSTGAVAALGHAVGVSLQELQDAFLALCTPLPRFLQVRPDQDGGGAACSGLGGGGYSLVGWVG